MAIRVVLVDDHRIVLEADLSAEVAGSIPAELLRDGLGRNANPGTELSDREREVLRLLAAGKISREIASELGVSIKTVISHRQSMLKKLGLRSVAELTAYAVRTAPLDRPGARPLPP